MWFQELFGKTNSFAIAVALEEDPSAVRDLADSVRKSWGQFTIYAGGRCLTRNITDERNSDAVHWYLKPLLVWLDANAVRMLNEEPFPGIPVGEVTDSVDWLDATLSGPPMAPTEEEEDRWFDERSRWAERRVLRFGMPGAIAPYLAFRRLGDYIEISWDNDGHPPTRPRVQFIESRGSVCVPASEVASVLRQVVQAVSPRIGAVDGFDLHGPLANGDGPGAEAWRWLVHPASRDLFDNPRLATHRERLAESVPRHGALVPHSLPTALLRAVPATSIAQIELLLELPSPPDALSPALQSERLAPPRNVREAWSTGYERARRLRHDLGWGTDPAPPLDQAMRELGVATRDADLVDGVHCAVAGFGNQRATAIISNNPGMRPRMRLATALGHVLFDVQTDHPFGTVSSEWSHWPTNARAKAFGAMLLMPEAEIRQMARRHGGVDASLVSAVMQRFDTGLEATTWHLYHLRMVSYEGRLVLIKQVQGSLE